MINMLIKHLLVTSRSFVSFHLNNTPKRQGIFFHFRDEETGREVSWVAQGHPILSGRAGTQTDPCAPAPAPAFSPGSWCAVRDSFPFFVNIYVFFNKDVFLISQLGF